MTIWLHYVGGNYTPASFREEAERERTAGRPSITRRAPLSVARQMNWEDRVYIATWTNLHSGKNWEEGIVHIFGLARIVGIIVDGCPKSFQDVFQKYSSLNRALRMISRGQGEVIRRECGTYRLGATLLVEDVPLPTVLQDLEATATRHNETLSIMLHLEPLEWFDPPREMKAPFTRSFLRLDSEETQGGSVGAMSLVEDHRLAPVDKKKKFMEPLFLGL